MSDQTLFEKILCGDIPGNFIARGENWASFLDVFPRSQGHTLVVPKRAAKRITELEETAMGYPGVLKSYAIQAGRELRVIVESEKVNDEMASKLSFDCC